MVNQGDIVLVDFNPTVGSEQKGPRPALVVSNNDFHKVTKKFALVVPITTKIRNHPLHIKLDSRTNTYGEIMCEQIKMIDTVARNVSYIEKLSDDLLEQVLDIIKLLF
ncbi:MAG: type II toxin-antitoxin system PemK/MazF family toxin [Acholeplasmatales bacterium]